MKTVWAAPVLLLIGLMVETPAGCERRGDADRTTVLKLAHGLDVTHPVHKGMAFPADKVREKSGSRLRIDIYPSEPSWCNWAPHATRQEPSPCARDRTFPL